MQTKNQDLEKFMKDDQRKQIEEVEEDKSNDPVTPLPNPNVSISTTSYFDKIVRFIPAGLNAAYVAILGLLAESDPAPAWLHWTVFLVLWSLVPLYILYIPGQIADKSVSKRYCVLAGVISFAVWCYALDGGVIAISFPEYYKPLYGSLLLIITTLILPVLEVVMKKFKYFKPDEDEVKSGL